MNGKRTHTHANTLSKTTQAAEILSLAETCRAEQPGSSRRHVQAHLCVSKCATVCSWVKSQSDHASTGRRQVSDPVKCMFGFELCCFSLGCLVNADTNVMNTPEAALAVKVNTTNRLLMAKGLDDRLVDVDCSGGSRDVTTSHVP